VDRVIKSAGVVRPNGQYFTPREGVEAARKLTVDTKTPYVAVRTVPAKLDPEIQKLIKNAQDPAAMETAHHALLNDRINTDPNVGAQMGRLVAFTAPFDVTGQPAISLPLHWNDDGLPIGVQLVAAYGREDVLLRVGAQLEDARPWNGRRPPISA